jgi:hypothetical protein
MNFLLVIRLFPSDLHCLLKYQGLSSTSQEEKVSFKSRRNGFSIKTDVEMRKTNMAQMLSLLAVSGVCSS